MLRCRRCTFNSNFLVRRSSHVEQWLRCIQRYLRQCDMGEICFLEFASTMQFSSRVTILIQTFRLLICSIFHYTQESCVTPNYTISSYDPLYLPIPRTILNIRLSVKTRNIIFFSAQKKLLDVWEDIIFPGLCQKEVWGAKIRRTVLNHFHFKNFR